MVKRLKFFVVAQSGGRTVPRALSLVDEGAHLSHHSVRIAQFDFTFLPPNSHPAIEKVRQ